MVLSCFFMFIPLLPFHWSMALEVGDKPLHVCDDFRAKPRWQAGLKIMESLVLAIHHQLGMGQALGTPKWQNGPTFIRK